MQALTRAERRGALLVLLLFLLGAAHDAWTARFPRTSDFDPVPAGPSPQRPGPAGVIDVNRAGVSELETLPGIGPVLAARIVGHRTRHGPFLRIEALLGVRGIGPRVLDRLRGRIATGDRLPGAAGQGPSLGSGGLAADTFRVRRAERNGAGVQKPLQSPGGPVR